MNQIKITCPSCKATFSADEALRDHLKAKDAQHAKEIANNKKIAQSANYTVYETNDKSKLRSILKNLQNKKGPLMIIVKIKNKKIVSKRITHEPFEIHNRFLKSI